MTCQQLDCMQRHAEGHGDLWHKQASILNESHQKTDTTTAATAAAAAVCRAASTTAATTTALATVPQRTAATTDCALDTLASGATINGTTVTTQLLATPTTLSTELVCVVGDAVVAAAGTCVSEHGQVLETAVGDSVAMGVATANTLCATLDELAAAPATTATRLTPEMTANTACNGKGNNSSNTSSNDSTTSSNSSRAVGACRKIIKSTTTTTPVDVTLTTDATVTKPNDWVVIPVFADIVKLALAGREECLQR